MLLLQIKRTKLLGFGVFRVKNHFNDCLREELSSEIFQGQAGISKQLYHKLISL